jgi:hypothetical protein
VSSAIFFLFFFVDWVRCKPGRPSRGEGAVGESRGSELRLRCGTSNVPSQTVAGLIMRDRRTLPSRQRTYIHLHVRVDRLEDEISHFYKVINELRTRVSMLEKQLDVKGGCDGLGERFS